MGSRAGLRGVAASFLLVAGWALALLGAAPARANQFDDCRAGHVVDGDTLYVTCAGREHHVRLLRVDTPERNEPGFAAARDVLVALVEGRRLRLEFAEPGEPSYGNYGRLLAYVFARANAGARGGDEVFVNAELIRRGASKFWTKYGRGRYAGVLAAAEAEARGARRGLAADRVFEDDDDFECRSRDDCCRVCRKGKACGDACVPRDARCRLEPGCACDAEEVGCD